MNGNRIRLLDEHLGNLFGIQLYPSIPMSGSARRQMIERYGTDRRLVQYGNRIYKVSDWMYELAN